MIALTRFIIKRVAHQVHKANADSTKDEDFETLRENFVGFQDNIEILRKQAKTMSDNAKNFVKPMLEMGEVFENADFKKKCLIETDVAFHEFSKVSNDVATTFEEHAKHCEALNKMIKQRDNICKEMVADAKDKNFYIVQSIPERRYQQAKSEFDQLNHNTKEELRKFLETAESDVEKNFYKLAHAYAMLFQTASKSTVNYTTVQ